MYRRWPSGRGLSKIPQDKVREAGGGRKREKERKGHEGKEGEDCEEGAES